MCLLFFQIKENPRDNEFKLILVNVRDEALTRSASPADWWPDHPAVIGGESSVYLLNEEEEELIVNLSCFYDDFFLARSRYAKHSWQRWWHLDGHEQG